MNSTAPASTFETIRIGSRKAACDGGGGALGHPRVFLSLAAVAEVVCPYCSRTYVYDAALASSADGHEH